MTMDFPLETKILLFFKLYLQNIFCGYERAQWPFSVLPLTFCSKLNVKLLVVSKFLIILSLRLGEASKLAPLGYFEISTNILVGYAFFGDLPDIWIYLGLSLIVFSGIYIFIRERREIKKTN